MGPETVSHVAQDNPMLSRFGTGFFPCVVMFFGRLFKQRKESAVPNFAAHIPFWHYVEVRVGWVRKQMDK